ncbi:MAG: hypothetical protein Q8922_09325 [Bacteroidota bacterium]|nr:hypothetical protein [Bacteroidota bacterium]MDP4243425.1 hypothetical protein [Bacteroidota bacterium]MDP4288124.1 hypothetical protein [Bacteroidota bacterium]
MSDINNLDTGTRYITFASIFEDSDLPAYVDAQDPDDPSGSMNGALEAIAVLPDILPPAAPPPSLKDRVMAHLQEPIVAIFVPPPTSA